MALSRYDEHADGWVRSQQTEDEAREWARDYGESDSWYWSPKWQAMTSITDGVTTVHDVADALARGDASPEIARLAADYWLMVGRHVQGAAAAATVGDVWRSWMADAAPDEHGYHSKPTGAAGATIQAGQGREVRAVYNVLYDPAYYAQIEGDGRAEDSYCDHIWAAAETHVAGGRTAADVTAARQAAAGRTDPDVSGGAWGAELAAHAQGGHYTDGESPAERDAERRYADAWETAYPDAFKDATGLTAIDSHDRMVASHHADHGYALRPSDNPSNRPRESDLRDSPPVSSPPEHEQPGPSTAANPGTARVAAHQRADDEASDASHAEAVHGASALADYARIVEHERDALYLALCDLAERTGEPIPPELDPLEAPTRTARHDEDEWSHNEAEIQAGIRWIHSDDHLPTKEPHESAAVDAADVTAGKSADEVLAGLLDDLDQARAQLESGDARGDDKHDLAGRIEQLEEGVAAQRERAARGTGAASQDDHQAGRDLAIAEILHEALSAEGPPVPPDQAAEFAAYAEMWAQEALADYDRDLEERTEADQSAEVKSHRYPVEDAGGDEPGKAHAADAVAAVRDAVVADTHRVAADQAQQAAQTHAAAGADADQRPAVGHGGDGHE